MKKHNEASAWFEDIYKKNEYTSENIPWAKHKVDPQLDIYLSKNNNENNKNKKALVVGCGLGDDAYALYEMGYDVTAIDVSKTALALAQERFPNTNIKFVLQDIFDMPEVYNEYFDFVFESLTIQSLPIEFREQMIQAISSTIQTSGKILLVAHKKTKDFKGPPYPLNNKAVNLFKKYKCKEISFEILEDTSLISNEKYCILYQKL
jgi:ubiquinone/menaquinone biosynthesis C-methylase UbiE